MYTQYFVHLICFCLTTAPCLANIQNFRQRYFRATNTLAITVKDRANYVLERKSSSKTACAVSCMLDEKCVFFEYTTETKLCRMATDKSGTHMEYYKYAKCPSDSGYNLWVYDDMALCVRYDSTKMNKTDSMAECERDGGHHFLIESEDMREHLEQLLGETGAAGITHLDGFDVNGNDVFLSWKGKPLPWVRWMEGNPNHGLEDCVEGNSSEGYALRDTYCRYKYYVVCQIDMV